MKKRQQFHAPQFEWEAFKSRHDGMRHLNDDPLYSLPPKLIVQLSEKIPGFFSDEERKFELDLAHCVGTCYFSGHPIEALALYRRPPELDVIMKSFREGELKKLEDQGVDLYHVRETENIRAERHKTAILRSDAYSYWLVRNQEYRHDLSDLRKRWNAEASRIGRFPIFDGSSCEHHSDQGPTGKRFGKDCLSFFSKWSLLTLLTWDIPVPLEPNVLWQGQSSRQKDTFESWFFPRNISCPHTELAPGFSPGVEVDISMDFADAGSSRPKPQECGATLFIPWPCLRGGKFLPNEEFRFISSEEVPANLRSWVFPKGRKGTSRHSDGEHAFDGSEGLYDSRLAGMFWIYRYDHLVLSKRYCDRHKGKTRALIEALSDATGAGNALTPEAVKRQREQVRRDF